MKSECPISAKLRKAMALLTMIAAPMTAAARSCSVLSDQDQTRLIKYVTSKYNIPPTVKFSIKSATPVTEDCYRKIVFAGVGPLGEFSMVLSASPDSRFLSREFMDSMLDPSLERSEKAQKVMGE